MMKTKGITTTGTDDGEILTEQYFIEHLRDEKAKKFYTEVRDKILHVDTYPKIDEDADNLFDTSYWRIQFRIKREDFGILSKRVYNYEYSVNYFCVYNEEDDTISVTTSELYK